MATRSELFRAQQERHRTKRATKRAKDHADKKSRAKRSEHAHENVRAAKRATVALEPRKTKGRPSRKSTRSSANRMKSDVNVSELRTERTHATPEARAAERRGPRAKR